MAKVRYDQQTNWAGGVVTAGRPESLPDGAYASAPNMQLKHIGGGSAILATRPGVLQHNTSKISAHTVLGQVEYRRYSSGAFTGYHLAVTAQGKLKTIAADGTVADADSGTPTPFTAGEYYPDFAAANNLIFIVNGQENKKFNGTSVQAVGGNAPAAPSVVDSGVAGNPNGTYEFSTTYYNSATGYETSRSAETSVTVASRQIDVSWVDPTDTQFDYVRVYVRKGTLSGSFFRCITGVTPAVDAATGGYSLATNSTRVNITDAQFNALLIPSPSTTENNKPPVLDRICFHQGRLFGVDPTDPSTLLHSKLSSENVEAFDPTFSIPVNVDDGDRITALESANELTLLIFKKNATYALRGSYPDWEIELVSAHVGCTSHLSVTTFNKITYFWSLNGPAASDGVKVELLAQPNLSDKVNETALEFDLLNKVCVGVDATHMRLLWALPDNAATRNSFILPYNILLGVFESERWEMLDVASTANVLNSDEVPCLFLGDYKGRVFKFDHTTFNDGVASGTRSGTPTSATSTTLTDTGASFLTTGDGLAQLYVMVIHEESELVQRKRIGSNTGTVLTLDSGETFDPVPDADWTYYIGVIKSKFIFHGDGQDTAFWKKRLEYITMDIVPPESAVEVDIHVIADLGHGADLHVDLEISGSAWDEALWDVAVWTGELPLQHIRQRVGANARTYIVEASAVVLDNPFGVARVGMRSVLRTEKS